MLNSIFMLFQIFQNVLLETERIIAVLKQRQKLGWNVKNGRCNPHTSTIVATVLPTSKFDFHFYHHFHDLSYIKRVKNKKVSW